MKPPIEANEPAGRNISATEVIEKALLLYYCLQDPDTPKGAKTTIIGGLGYLILPTDAIPDMIPIVGFTDDLGALALAFGIVAAHIKREHKEKAKDRLREWCSSDDE